MKYFLGLITASLLLIGTGCDVASQTVDNGYEETPSAVYEEDASEINWDSLDTEELNKETSPTYNDDSEVDYYYNSQGNQVQSPTYYLFEPAGATARCEDGTYSFSQSRSGTCSHHGGVAEWL